MNDFDYERRQRTDLAKQAKYRKRGSKSKRCPLSTDHMTMKQWKERNGAIVSINLSKPIRNWDEFKSYPHTLQREYLDTLISRYHANLANLADMLSVTPRVLKKHLDEIGYTVAFQRGKRMPAESRSAWMEFLYPPEMDQMEGVPTDPARLYKAEPDVNPAPEEGFRAEWEDIVLKNPTATTIKAAGPDPMRMSSFELVFRGPVDLTAVCNSLRAMYVEGSNVVLKVNCQFEP